MNHSPSPTGISSITSAHDAHRYDSIHPQEADVAIEAGADHAGIKVTNVTGENSQSSFFYAALEKFLKSAYKFFSYVSYYLTCCFSKNSFEDVTESSVQNVSAEDAESIIARASAEIVTERQHNQKTVREYGDYYSDYAKAYQEQEEFLKSYLETLRGALSSARAKAVKFGFLEEIQNSDITPNENDIPADSGYELYELMNEVNCNLKILKNVPELRSLAEKTTDLLFTTKTNEQDQQQLSAKALASAIKIQVDYFKRNKDLNYELQRDVELLASEMPHIKVNYTPDNAHGVAECLDRAIDPVRLPEAGRLETEKTNAVHSLLSLKSSMITLEKEIKENLGTQVMQGIEKLETRQQKEQEAKNEKLNQQRKESKARGGGFF